MSTTEQDEIKNLKTETEALRAENTESQNRILELEEQVYLLESEAEYQFNIDTGRGSGIQYSASNLLDQQIMEALADLIESSNNVTLLQHLESLKKLRV